jgi:hypothetical protein
MTFGGKLVDAELSVDVIYPATLQASSLLREPPVSAEAVVRLGCADQPLALSQTKPFLVGD